MKYSRGTLSDFIEFNPRESLPKGNVAKEIAMADLIPFQKKISNYNISPYKGGMKFRNGDTLLARITPCLENGKTAYVDILNEDEVGFGSTEYIVLRAIPQKTIPEFVFYFAISDWFRKRAIALMTGSSGRQRVQTDKLMDLEVIMPDLETQKKIVRILSALDKKIELNNQQNEKLMETALSFYRDLRDKQVEKWEFGYIGDGKMTKIEKSGVPKYYGIKKYVATADVTDTIITHFEEVSYNEKPSRANMLPKEDTIWFAKMEGSVKNILVADYSTDLIRNYVFSTGFMGIKCLNSFTYFMWCYINDKNFHNIKNALSTGTLMAGISNSTIKKAKYPIPPQDFLNDFNSKVKPIFEKIYNNSLQNESLSDIRDTLLPKLMAGKINLGNVES